MITEDERWKEQFSDHEEGGREGYRPYNRSENHNSYRTNGQPAGRGQHSVKVATKVAIVPVAKVATSSAKVISLVRGATKAAIVPVVRAVTSSARVAIKAVIVREAISSVAKVATNVARAATNVVAIASAHLDIILMPSIA